MLSVVPCVSPTVLHANMSDYTASLTVPGPVSRRSLGPVASELGVLSDRTAKVRVVGDLVFFNVGPRRGMRKGTSASVWYERGLELEATDPDAAIAAYRRAVAG